MTTVRKLLEAKPDETNYFVAVSDTVFRALEVMAEAHIGAVMVKDGDKFVGIYTERDCVTKGELQGRSAKTTLVKDVMTGDMYSVAKDTSVVQCMALMNTYRIRHLPVVENGQLVGLVSIRDVVNAMLADKESEIRGLENYILGSGFAT